MREIQQFAVNYIPEITEVLNRVPRQMILLLKTNDLLRGIDSKLSAPKSFVTLSRCCVRAVKEHELANCNGVVCWFKINAQATIDQLRISIYQLSLSPVGRLIGNIWMFITSNPFSFIFQYFSKNEMSIENA